ncbi:MAG: hypothetical protein K1X70_19020 [Leptospirales bacterium]|nr:hypothetical protein [Leptospirales bacterium]HMU82679.1 hypothetical protein [Leptospiraceae bacterium]HMZ37095.1 hypothetical protein [Leptospiraceae bacterium]HNL69761.1 hypothetical protein [Leptospiraceae bacterium]HNN59054.1 hypothetical protein [Leptospiraceae bacterium]
MEVVVVTLLISLAGAYLIWKAAAFFRRKPAGAGPAIHQDCSGCSCSAGDCRKDA